MRLAVISILALAPTLGSMRSDYFVPRHRISGVGVAREDLTESMIAVRTRQMVESQTFAIMREPLAVAGARRITSPKLQALFKSAAGRSGIPASVIESIAYLESWGDPKAESPAGPRGIMQISEATARRMGLKVVRATRYKKGPSERVLVKRKGRKPTYKTVSKRIPYTVTLRDDRLTPERAIPAAAQYLAGVEQRFGGRDWAIFAYHCGEGCVAEMQDLTRRARGVSKDDVTVARMFFSAHPAWNRELYEAVQHQMERDYSPTYWFRVQRAAELLALYRRDPAAFLRLSDEFKSQFSAAPRAPHRLAVWLKRDDLSFRSCEDLRAAEGSRLVQALDRPEYFGYSLRKDIGAEDPANRRYYLQASPAAIGTLTYIAYETRRLYAELHPHGEKFQPLEVTSLVQPMDRVSNGQARGETLSHCTGQVFDISYTDLPPGERECLRFILNDLGWQGYLGFVEEGTDRLHVGCSPTSREFFTSVFQETGGEDTAASDANSSPAL